MRRMIHVAPQAAIAPSPVWRILVLARAVGVILMIGLVILVAARSPARAGGAEFRAFIEQLWPQARARGVTRATFDAAFDGVTLNPAVLKLTKSQAEFVKPIWDYLGSAVSSDRVGKGREKAQAWEDSLSRAEKLYGVDRYIVLGVWGMETNFGGFVGDNYVVRALATLAYARYRGDYFREELLSALEILEQGHVSPRGMIGSWAGAMGQTQFMPSSFKKYAVDFDGRGRKDIWTSVPDAVGSTANYLAQHGWIKGETWGYEVMLPKGFSLAKHDQSTDHAFSAWAADGVTRADGEAMPGSGEASLLLPAGAHGPAFLVTPNFKVIKSYNNSTSYALGVALLGDRIAGWPALRAAWPRGERPLNVRQTREVQSRLARMGFAVGDLDGKLGDKAREAIRAYQARAGLEPDGYASLKLLETMRVAR